jgi:hypothetical protein
MFTLGTASACPEGDTGAGSGAKEPVVQLPQGDHNHDVYLEVQWEPGNRPVEVSYTVNGDFHGYKTYKNSPFVLSRIQTGDAEISLHARQKEQGWLRSSIEVDGVEHSPDVSTEYNGSVDSVYKPSHPKKPTA